ncbi:hypothetical protein BC829DRAFT_149082 [Chytridium lagenaria]|nr:hypothetical protein BC829DRAFT_149082 [Chytridium lagenaria]
MIAAGGTWLNNAVGLPLVALCWGSTNPFIKRGSRGLQQITDKHINSPWWKRTAAEYWFLLTRWQYVVPLAINLSGSMVYYYTLGQSDLSNAVVVTNSVTFAVTLLTGYALGEEKELSARSLFGMSLVGIGVALCLSAKQES